MKAVLFLIFILIPTISFGKSENPDLSDFWVEVVDDKFIFDPKISLKNKNYYISTQKKDGKFKFFLKEKKSNHEIDLDHASIEVDKICPGERWTFYKYGNYYPPRYIVVGENVTVVDPVTVTFNSSNSSICENATISGSLGLYDSTIKGNAILNGAPFLELKDSVVEGDTIIEGGVRASKVDFKGGYYSAEGVGYLGDDIYGGWNRITLEGENHFTGNYNVGVSLKNVLIEGGVSAPGVSSYGVQVLHPVGENSELKGFVSIRGNYSFEAPVYGDNVKMNGYPYPASQCYSNCYGIIASGDSIDISDSEIIGYAQIGFWTIMKEDTFIFSPLSMSSFSGSHFYQFTSNGILFAYNYRPAAGVSLTGDWSCNYSGCSQLKK